MTVKEFDRRWDITPEEIQADKKFCSWYDDMFRRAKQMMDMRTRHHKTFSRISHMQNLYNNGRGHTFSEGTTQSIKRKIRSETIQRVPDGEIVTQFDKNSIEQIEIQFIFDNKILRSEYQNRDMLKNLWRTFDASYDYGYGCVRTGFEEDSDGDIRVKYELIQWNNILPEPDCDFIEEASWYMVRDYVSQTTLDALLDEEGNLLDTTYEEKTVKYLVENEPRSGIDPRSNPLADDRNRTAKSESIEVWTLYRRGDDEFITFVPGCNAILRRVKNWDPRKDVPLHFLILEPDPDFPLGCSSVMWTLAQQQFADAFQTLSYETLLLATQPPIKVYGNLTNAKLAMKPRAIWNMGTNANANVDKFPVETTTLTQYGAILQNVSANMMKNMNATDQTVATDANVAKYSGTPQGVEQQQRDKTVTVNQFQKRVEVFFSDWANHALRSYLNAMTGKQKLTVTEETRRRIYDIEQSNAPTDPITGEPMPVDTILGEDEDYDKAEFDFSALSVNMLEFKVRTGSLIESEKEQEIDAIQKLLVPVSQMLGAVSDENKRVFETTILQLVQRLCELSNVDISAQSGARFGEQYIIDAMKATMEQVMAQQNQINQMMQQIMPQPQQPQMAPQGQPMPQEQPMPQGQPMPQEGMPQEQMPPEQMPEENPEMAPEIPELLAQEGEMAP